MVLRQLVAHSEKEVTDFFPDLLCVVKDLLVELVDLVLGLALEVLALLLQIGQVLLQLLLVAHDSFLLVSDLLLSRTQVLRAELEGLHLSIHAGLGGLIMLFHCVKLFKDDVENVLLLLVSFALVVLLFGGLLFFGTPHREN